MMEFTGKKADEAMREIAPMMEAYSDIQAGKLNCEKYKELCRIEDGETIVDDGQEKYLAEVLKLDPLKELSRVTVPVLVMQGTSDFIVSPKQFELARKALSPKKNFAFQSLDGVDHFMSDEKDKRSSFQMMAKVRQTKTLPPLSPKLLEATETWLKAREPRSTTL